MCVALSFLFCYLLSTRCGCRQIGRAFEASIDHKTLLCDHMLLLASFIAYFLKKNYSLRQNILKKNEKLREVTHISPNWCLFGSYSSWDLIGNRQCEGSLKFCWKKCTGRCTRRCCPVFGQFTGGELLVKE